MTSPRLISDVERQAAAFAQSHKRLSERARRLQLRVAELQRQARSELRALADTAAQDRAALVAAIEAAPGMFAKPRTQRLSGVRVGFRKKPGRIEFTDEQKVIERIRALLPADQAYMLIRTRESVEKKALADIELSDLRRIGVRLTDDEDVVVVDPGDRDLDRFIAALIADAADDEPEAA